MEIPDQADKPQPKQRKPRKATPRSLKNAARYHLERFASSSDNLRRVLSRRVLSRRVERSARTHDTDRAEGLEAIDEIIARFEAAGLLDDQIYARNRAPGYLRRAGIRRRLCAAPPDGTLPPL